MYPVVKLKFYGDLILSKLTKVEKARQKQAARRQQNLAAGGQRESGTYYLP